MRTLTWDKVNAWRLAQHSLSRHLPSDDLIQAVIRTCGIQAQVMSAAELAIGARVDGISPCHVQSALWQNRTLIKTWAMRAALHLIPACEFPLYIAARKLTNIRIGLITSAIMVSTRLSLRITWLSVQKS